MKHYLTTISLFSLLLLFTSCCTSKKSISENTVSPKESTEIIEKYWKLIEIKGQKVTADDFASKEPHLILKSTDNRVSGNGGCNSFFGTYELQTDVNRISFSKIGSTKMACMKATVENDFLNVLETVDNYTVKNDTLQLNKARMAPLAKFVAVYLK
ncbi:META domain-containing protein [Flavobacterium sufflavum]|uniref:META domain-containing protein n=1 Tax=Flavobacterium sufflavum TaxID=1921138 RepID=A0A3S2XE40_9FLAO|nr:META domain-containing protein [Flavobacterium sufflavum]RVT76636.1 META domain-containing protein [Flavobacterium sufflavum]